ncbi:hypothetical protein GGI21_001558 [Coemansia aciculifera]|nr:hypothetical protein GGI21_001558 [Coemansia aciculifera]
MALENDDDDEDIEEEEEAYLKHLQESDLSSSSLSDLDDSRLAVIRGDIDSGEESDSESCGEGRQRFRVRRAQRQQRQRQRRLVRDDPPGFGLAESDSEGMGELSSLGSDGSSSETDEELEFRAPRTAEERALAAYTEPGDDREDALLVMHLDQLRAVRSVIQDCSSSPPLLDDSDVEGEITFTYRSGSDSRGDLSDDLMAGWATDARRRWDSDSSSGSSCLSESNLGRLRLPEDDSSGHSDLYSSDSPDEFYTSSAFMDMEDDDMYPSELDLDGASLALGVALSMEQQGYSKEDAAAAAAVAAAAYPNSAAKQEEPTTTITASMNANGEADPIDGIVSIKSNTAAASRMATGTHTPYATSSGWRVAAAAAVAAAYLDSSLPPPVSYVLPKDLNEARSPDIAMAAAAQAETETSECGGDLSATARMSTFSIASEEPERSSDSAAKPPTSGGFLSSQLSNSSFYKPLSSILLPVRRTSSAAVSAAPPADPPLSCAEEPSNMPVISLAEVNAALSALVDHTNGDMWAAEAGSTGVLKRKLDDPLACPTDADKRRRGDVESDHDVATFDLDALFGTGVATTPQQQFRADHPPPLSLAMGAGTPMRGTNAAASDDDDWLLAMDQLVDTEALLIKSPLTTPVDPSSMLGLDMSQHSSSSLGARPSMDPFARWDRIPVNIFRRSRALASSNRKDAMSGMAITAIKSSRQRRALVNSTLLTQHTLVTQQPPPPPPPTPLSSRSASMRGSHYTASAPLPMSLLAPPPPPPRSARKSDATDSSIYAFGWLEDDEDLALFAMPELATSDAHQPSMTMMLAASAVSPMLRPIGPSSADAMPEPKRQ